MRLNASLGIELESFRSVIGPEAYECSSDWNGEEECERHRDGEIEDYCNRKSSV